MSVRAAWWQVATILGSPGYQMGSRFSGDEGVIRAAGNIHHALATTAIASTDFERARFCGK